MPWTAKLYATKVVQRLKQAPDKILQALEDSWPGIVEAVVADVLERTPSKEEEYLAIMGETTAGGIEAPALAGDESDDPDKPRTRFKREPGMWLSELVAMEGIGYISSPEALTIQLGNTSLLNEMSKFSWVNVRGRRVHFGAVVNEGDPIEHVTTYGVWSFFEYGTSHSQSPLFDGNYYLNPDGQHSHRIESMTKSYPALRMFTGYNRSIFRNAVRDAIRSVEL